MKTLEEPHANEARRDLRLGERSTPAWSSTTLEHGDAVRSALWLVNLNPQQYDHVMASVQHEAAMELFMDVRSFARFRRLHVRLIDSISLTQALEDSSDDLGSARATIVRRLQDLSSESGQFLQRFQLSSITDRKFVSSGSEASIWSGRLGEKPVVARQANLPTVGGSWDSEEGRLVLKVCSPLSSHSSQLTME